MKEIRTIILRAPGTNCELETQAVFQLAGTTAEIVLFSSLLKNPKYIKEFQILILPGGFSFGDYLGSGTVFALYLSQIKEHLIKFIEEGKIILGICNGFQILIRAGLLPNWKDKKIQASLTFNKSSKFEARWVKLRIVSKKYDYIKMMPKKYIYLPVAHGEGRFVTSEKKMIDRLYENNQVLFEYAESRYPSNPNGSERNIAGITSPEGHIIGMMPHPERFYTPYLFPNWQNNQNNQHPDGLLFIKAVVDYVKKTLN